MVAAVIDSSAIIELFVRPRPDPGLRRRSLTETLVAPEIADCEVLNVLRRLERVGQLSSAYAELAVTRLTEAPIIRVTHRPLIRRIWTLRHTVTAYDAAYVALAEQLDLPLVTCDARLAKAHEHDARVELYPRSSP
jgi:predicted nucleic acid-binding protein